MNLNRLVGLKLLYILFSLLIYSNSGNKLLAQSTVDSIFSSIENLNTDDKFDTVAVIIKNIRNSDPAMGIELGTKILANVNYNESTVNLARVFDEMGVCYRKLGENNSAVKYNFEALKIFKDKNDRMNEAFALHNIGNVYRYLNQYDMSLKHLFESLEIKKELKDSSQISFSLNVIGLVYEERGMLDSAEIYMIRALNIAMSLKNEINLANIYSNLGSVECKANQFQKAEEFLLKCLSIYQKGNADYGISQAILRLSKTYLYSKKYNKAFSTLEKGMKIVREIKAKDLEKEFLYLYSDYYKKNRNFKKANDYLKNYIDLKDTLEIQNRSKQVTHAEYLYQLNQRIQENELLIQEKEITELKLSRQNLILLFTLVILALGIAALLVLLHRNKKINEINSQLQEKEQTLRNVNENLEELNNTQKKILSIIAHDLNNPFNYLILSTTMMLESYDEMDDEEKIEILKGMVTVSNESHFLLSNLLEWSRIQTGKLEAEKKKVYLYKMVNESLNMLSKLADHKMIEIINDIDSSIEVCADQNMLNTILRNLITNSIKFSISKSKINIAAQEENSSIIICIKDEGIGMKKEILDNLFTTSPDIRRRGTSNESGSGLGLLLCKELVEKNNGEIWADSKLNYGTRFYFSLPKSKS